MRAKFALLVSASLSVLCLTSAGQGKASVHGNLFREPTIGLTYEFPEKVIPKVENKNVFGNDSTGREQVCAKIASLARLRIFLLRIQSELS